jgi:hypothetical protein
MLEAAAPSFGGDFTVANALAILLTTESLLFSALALAYNVTAGGGRGVRNLPISAAKLGGVSVGVLMFVAAGAGAAWWEIFACNFPSHVSGILIAIGIAVAIVAEPVLAVLFGLGLRKKP